MTGGFKLRTIQILSVFIFLSSGALFSGCLVQTDNSVNGDASIFSNPPSGSTQAFANVSAILKKNCVPCHASDIVSFSEQQLLAQGYVVAKDPDASMLYARLTGSNAGGSFQETMPQGGPPLSSDDLATIRNWIDQIAAISPTPTPVPSPIPSIFPNTPFGNAYAIISVSCVSCHHHQSWASFGESDFVSGNLVTPGNADTSLLYQKLTGANVPGVASGDMPDGGPPLTADQLQTISTWIDQIPVGAP
jgi:cytochrome c553